MGSKQEEKPSYLKHCTKCGASNRDVKFYPYRKVCKICERERAAEYRIENPEKIKAYTKTRYQRLKANPEKLKKVQEAANACRRKRYANSPDERYKQKERSRDYRARKLSKRISTLENTAS